MRFIPKRLKARTRSPKRKVLEKILREEFRSIVGEHRGLLTR